MTVNKDLGWKDISKESYRAYLYFKDGYFVEVAIKNPFRLALSDNGHRIVDRDGVSYYMPKGWIQLRWEGYNKGEPEYAF